MEDTTIRVEMEFPCFLYIYELDGFHRGYEVIESDEELKASAGKIKAAIQEGREVRITDLGDYLLFHAEKGQILFPTRADIERFK